MQRIKVTVIKTEEERHAMERKAGETELLMHRMVEEAERRQQEADRLRSEVRLEIFWGKLIKCEPHYYHVFQVKQARAAEKEAKTKLIEFLNISVTEVKTSPTSYVQPK